MIAEVNVPDTPLVTAAIDSAQRLSEPYLFNHAMRSWLFAEAIGRAKRLDFDHEVVAIGTILHDIGLTPGISGANRFEVNGADAAVSFIRGRGLSDRRTQLIWDLVALNSTPSCRLVTERRQTSYDNFLRDLGERFVPGYTSVSTVDLLMKAPFDE